MQRHALSPSTLVGLSDFVGASLGLHFPAQRLAELERAFVSTARDLGDSDAEGCARRLVSPDATRSELEALTSHLTVGETYFFREHESLRFIAEHIVPELLRARTDARPLRIWSAGCCSGEEPYSIAMLLDSLVPGAPAIEILATDVNSRFLRKAAEATYSEWSFRQTLPGMRERYFHKRKDGRWQLHSKFRRMVAFSSHNLATDPYPALPALDVIVCRNVLMYFSAERVKEVAEKFHRSLMPGGWLIVSATEAGNHAFSMFRAIPFSGGTLYQKAIQSPLPACGERVRVRGEVSPPDSPPHPNPLPRLGGGEGTGGTEVLDPAHYYRLSAVQCEAGEPDAAMQSLRRALFLDPGFVLAHFGLASLELARGHARQAERHLRNAIDALRAYAHDEIVPESEGLTAGRLAEIFTSLRRSA